MEAIMGTCHLTEPSTTFKTITKVTYTYDDGSTDVVDGTPQPATELYSVASSQIGLVLVDGQLMTKTDFDAKYTVDAPL
jgi:hypothetical protein